MNKSSKQKEELRKGLDKVISQIKSNSKDSRFTGELIKSLLSIKGQMDVVPSPVDFLGEEVNRFTGKTFVVSKHENGAVFHTYGGYSVVVRPNQTSLYETLVDLVDNQNVYAQLEGEEKNVFELDLQARVFCIMTPSIVFGDIELTYEIATKIVNYMKSLQDKAEESLDKEDHGKNESFRVAATSMSEIENSES